MSNYTKRVLTQAEYDALKVFMCSVIETEDMDSLRKWLDWLRQEISVPGGGVPGSASVDFVFDLINIQE